MDLEGEFMEHFKKLENQKKINNFLVKVKEGDKLIIKQKLLKLKGRFNIFRHVRKIGYYFFNYQLNRKRANGNDNKKFINSNILVSSLRKRILNGEIYVSRFKNFRLGDIFTGLEFQETREFEIENDDGNNNNDNNDNDQNNLYTNDDSKQEEKDDDNNISVGVGVSINGNDFDADSNSKNFIGVVNDQVIMENKKKDNEDSHNKGSNNNSNNNDYDGDEEEESGNNTSSSINEQELKKEVYVNKKLGQHCILKSKQRKVIEKMCQRLSLLEIRQKEMQKENEELKNKQNVVDTSIQQIKQIQSNFKFNSSELLPQVNALYQNVNIFIEDNIKSSPVKRIYKQIEVINYSHQRINENVKLRAQAIKHNLKLVDNKKLFGKQQLSEQQLLDSVFTQINQHEGKKPTLRSIDNGLDLNNVLPIQDNLARSLTRNKNNQLK